MKRDKEENIMTPRMPGTSPTIETRHDSHVEVLPNKQRRYKQIIECIRENGPMTAKECAVAMFEKGYSKTAERNVSAPRLNELCEIGVVEPIGKKKCMYTGKTVAVYGLRRN